MNFISNMEGGIRIDNRSTLDCLEGIGKLTRRRKFAEADCHSSERGNTRCVDTSAGTWGGFALAAQAVQTHDEDSEGSLPEITAGTRSLDHPLLAESSRTDDSCQRCWVSGSVGQEVSRHRPAKFAQASCHTFVPLGVGKRSICALVHSQLRGKLDRPELSVLGWPSDGYEFPKGIRPGISFQMGHCRSLAGLGAVGSGRKGRTRSWLLSLAEYSPRLRVVLASRENGSCERTGASTEWGVDVTTVGSVDRATRSCSRRRSGNFTLAVHHSHRRRHHRGGCGGRMMQSV